MRTGADRSTAPQRPRESRSDVFPPELTISSPAQHRRLTHPIRGRLGKKGKVRLRTNADGPAPESEAGPLGQ